MKSELEEAKKMIDEGFKDLELLSFELDIPLEVLEKYKADIEKKSKKQIIELEKEVNPEHYKELENLRRKYYQLYNSKNDTTPKSNLSQDEIKLIDNKIGEILKELKELQVGKVTGKVAEKIRQLDTELDKSISIKTAQTENIDELKKILKLIPIEINKRNPITYSSMKHKVNSKISKLTQENAIKAVKNSIPQCLIIIVEELAKGTLNLRKANEIIDEEIEKKSSEKKKVFSLTKEQIRNQIMIKIRSKLKEYDIEHPQLTIEQLQALSGEEIQQSIKAVIDNLIQNGKLDLAKNTCDRYCGENDMKNELYIHINSFRKDITKAEIGKLILDVINLKGTYDEEKAYYDKIKRLMQNKRLNLEGISLGTTKDGTKTITAADLFSDKIKE